MLDDCVWGDFIVLTLIATMWGVRITVVRGDSCGEVRLRHNCALINSDFVILFNGRELTGHYSAVTRCDQSKLKATPISKTKEFDYRVDTSEVERKFHRLEAGQIVVKADYYAALRAKSQDLDDLKEDCEKMKNENKIIKKSLKEKEIDQKYE